MNYVLKPLPYSSNALSPIISKEIMELHHDKHHLAYINGTNSALELLEKSRTGEEINIKTVMKDLSFNLNGHFLHELFWNCMRSPNETNLPSKSLISNLSNTFGNFEHFKIEFSNAAKSVEGSGWAILYVDRNRNFFIGQLEKHNLLGIIGLRPLLVLDVWEHAYYLDYKNDRAKYVEEWWKLVNWNYVESLLT